ncbi:hypothetical protein QBC34DRAFT_469206 [Podospora aff. communis PSN243]|uniref:Uncharacterized protein n=1 Tax=Podospora aff. communis PSN243 TaxID=3040156 RepID=A0AAV9GI83_9PEZI|nr:hypothetical protein QBC34DRAFT_469206 [Podospora aff. communis PSN243]
MKTTIAAQFLAIVLSAHSIMAAPAAEARTDFGTSKIQKRYWVLNCTGGNTNWCRNVHDTTCSGSWPLTNNAWCAGNCDCYWEYSCPGLGGCRTGEEEEAKAKHLAEVAAQAAEVPPTIEAA